MTNIEAFFSQYFDFLNKRGSRFNTFLGVVCIIIVVIMDTFSPAGYEFDLLYLLPVAFTTWFAGFRAGLFITVLCTSYMTRYHYNMPFDVAAWNILSAFGIFFCVITMVSKIRGLMQIKHELSRTDHLTGVCNLRAFKELAEYELQRSRREKRPFSIAYLDIDNFKQINDRYGHSKGDELLRDFAACITRNIRKTDIIARIGGDEFTILFPATDQTSVKVVAQKVIEDLDLFTKSRNWPTTVSMGVITYAQASCGLDEIIAAADRLMYEVKKAGKNNVRYEGCPD